MPAVSATAALPVNLSAEDAVKSVAKLPENVTITSAPDTDTEDADLESTLAKSPAATVPELSVSLNVYVMSSRVGPVTAESNVGANPSVIATLVTPTP